jgi:RNA polymerase sigma-70 factor (ECF subfamily)
LSEFSVEAQSPPVTPAELVDRYGDAVYRYCRSLTYCREDADDLFQETFTRALEQLSKLEANPQSFLFSTALYVWKGWKRKYARRRRIAPVEPLSEWVTASNGAGPEDGLLAREETRAVRALVNALPDKLKHPVILYYTAELSVPEVAAALGIPQGTVKSRLFKARKLIEKGLEDFI